LIKNFKIKENLSEISSLSFFKPHSEGLVAKSQEDYWCDPHLESFYSEKSILRLIENKIGFGFFLS